MQDFRFLLLSRPIRPFFRPLPKQRNIVTLQLITGSMKIFTGQVSLIFSIYTSLSNVLA